MFLNWTTMEKLFLTEKLQKKQILMKEYYKIITSFIGEILNVMPR